MTREIMNLSDIRIQASFARTMPGEGKINKCRDHLEKYGCLDRVIKVNSDRILVDGYVAYLILLEKGVKQTEVVNVDDTIYVYGCHKNYPKEYCWRISKRTKGLDQMKIGNKMVVCTKGGGSNIATITKIEKENTPPVNCYVRKVIRFFK